MYIIDIINSMPCCVVSSELVGRDHGTACNIKRQRYDCCMKRYARNAEQNDILLNFQKARERERERSRVRVYTLSRKIFHAL